MTPSLLLVIVVALFAVLLRQIRSLWRYRNSGHTISSPGAPPLAREPKPARAEAARPVNDTERPPKRARKRGLSSIHADSDANGVAVRLLNSGLYNEIEGNLAQAFELYADGSISLDRYEAIVQSEAKAVHRKRSELRARELTDGSSPASLDELRQDVESAEIAIQWCLDWAADRRGAAASDEARPDQAQPVVDYPMV